jgi:hypothetical protein
MSKADERVWEGVQEFLRELAAAESDASQEAIEPGTSDELAYDDLTFDEVGELYDEDAFPQRVQCRHRMVNGRRADALPRCSVRRRSVRGTDV